MKSSINPTNSWELSTVRVHLREDGIIVCEMIPGTVQTIKDYQELVLLLVRIVGSEKRPMLTIIPRGAQVKPDALAYARKVEYLVPINAIAIVVPTRLEFVLAKAYQVVQKPSLPQHVFYKEEEAMEWLKAFVPAEIEIPAEF